MIELPIVRKQIDLWLLHERFTQIDNNGVKFLQKYVDEGNVVANLLLRIHFFFNSNRPLTSEEFIKYTANKNHAQGVYNFGVQQLMWLRKKGFAIFSKLYSNNQDKRVEIMGFRANFRKMADQIILMFIQQTFSCEEISLIGTSAMRVHRKI